MKKIKCDFCKEKGEWKCVLRAEHIKKTDDTNLILCNNCMELYINEDWEKLTKRLKNEKG